MIVTFAVWLRKPASNHEKFQGAVSLKLAGGQLAPKLVYFVLRTELLNF